MSKHLKLILPVFVAAILLVILYFSIPAAFKNDYHRFTTEKYTVAFLSMFPIDNYSEEDFSFYFAQDALKSAYCIPNGNILEFYMKKIASSGNTISTVYIGVQPDKIPADKLLSILSAYPSVNFQIILPYPTVDYWNGFSDEELENTLQSYRELADFLLVQNNAKVYSFNREWIICNPANYEDTFLTTKDISHTILLNCDENHGFYITADNIDTAFAEFRQLITENRTAPTVYPDLSDYKIVFFGDSVIGNYTDSASIPGVVNGLTGATVYNCGYGGNSAARHDSSLINLPGIADAFIAGDSSRLPEDTQVLAGITEYLQDNSATEKLCFVINYGLNDYFNGAPVSTEDPYDLASYSGALRTALTSLQQAYPGAQILLLSPNYTSYFGHGTEINSEVGGVLTDYVDAVIQIGEEYNVAVLDNYGELGINAENVGFYLLDGCHPNEATRFTIGERIALNIK